MKEIVIFKKNGLTCFEQNIDNGRFIVITFDKNNVFSQINSYTDTQNTNISIDIKHLDIEKDQYIEALTFLIKKNFSNISFLELFKSIYPDIEKIDVGIYKSNSCDYFLLKLSYFNSGIIFTSSFDSTLSFSNYSFHSFSKTDSFFPEDYQIDLILKRSNNEYYKDLTSFFSDYIVKKSFSFDEISFFSKNESIFIRDLSYFKRDGVFLKLRVHSFEYDIIVSDYTYNSFLAFIYKETNSF